MARQKLLGALLATIALGCSADGTTVIDKDTGTTPPVDRNPTPPPPPPPGPPPPPPPPGTDGGMDALVPPPPPVDGGTDDDVVRPTFDVAPLDVMRRDVQPNYDAFFADNPPPRYCGPDGSAADAPAPPPLPGGTPECPDDLTHEGCECTTIGEMHSCWPGARANRNRGICRDGMARCEPYDELSGRWGPCVGAVLPTPGVVRGPGACQCFSQGRWQIDNTSPCFVQTGGLYYAVSTYLSGMTAQCPTLAPGARPPFMPMAGQPFSTNSLTVDCTGQFELCYAIKAGSAATPLPTDCTVARVCTSAWYGTRNVAQTFPPLPGWSGMDQACAQRFVMSGGYGEMSVVGQSSECEMINDRGAPYVFNRVTYCPLRCNMTPTLPECVGCGNGGSGMF